MRALTFCLLSLTWLVTPGLAQEVERPDAVRLELTDGRILVGQVFDLRKGELEVREKRGSTRVSKSDVRRWAFEPGSEGLRPGVVILKNGHQIEGKVLFDEERGEWTVDFHQGAARYQDDLVLRVLRPDGQCSDGAYSPRLGFPERVKATIEALVTSPAPLRPDHREELLAFGFFAVPSIEKALRSGPDPGGELAAVLNHERLRVYLPSEVGDTNPRFLEDLTEGEESIRLRALRDALLDGHDIFALLAQLVLDRNQPTRVRSYCVETLRSRNRIADLLNAYQESSGQAQVALAIALGDLGIYVGIPTLIESLSLENAEARKLAARKLLEYTGEDFSYDAAAGPGQKPHRGEPLAELVPPSSGEDRGDPELRAESESEQSSSAPRGGILA